MLIGGEAKEFGIVVCFFIPHFVQSIRFTVTETEP